MRGFSCGANRCSIGMAQLPQIPTGRPVGSTSFEPQVAAAFGQAVRAQRVALGVSQEELAHQAELQRAHVGRIERGENQPTLSIVFKLASALEMSAGALVDMAGDLIVEQAAIKRR